jgi:hypothetical protein
MRWITPELAAQQSIRRVTSHDGAEAMGRNGAGDYAGLLIPNVWPGTDRPREYRLRRDHPEVEYRADGSTREINRYLSPLGRSNLFYFPLGVTPEMLTDSSIPVILTEGEFKAIALWRLSTWQSDRPRFLVVGIGGVWNWRGCIGKTVDADGERVDVKGVIADFARLTWRKRGTLILFDSDSDTNGSVKAARALLGRELRSLVAKVAFFDWPKPPAAKGIDDWLALSGPAAVLPYIEAALDSGAKPETPSQARGEPIVEDRDNPQSVLPEFPEIAWRGIFDDWRAAMNGTTEACDAAHFATFWAAVAVILGRRVEMHAGDTIYPNVYLAVYGETGDKKTTAERRISACNLFEHWPHIRLVRGVGSTEGLADELADSETGVYLFMWEEFATFLSHARWTGSTLLEFITECFDCPSEWSKAYRKKSIRLQSPTPSILTATTAEWFWKHAKAEDFFGGFGNRFLFLTGARKPPLPNPNIVDPDDIARIKEHLKLVAQSPACRACWTAPARKIWDAFYIRSESSERSGLLCAATKRTHIYVRKLAITYAALEHTLPYIDADQLEAAIAVIEYAVACAERLLDLQAATSKPQAALEERFLRYIAKHEGERVRRLQQKMARYCGDAETFNRVLKSLRQADRIEIEDRRVCLSP